MKPALASHASPAIEVCMHSGGLDPSICLIALAPNDGSSLGHTSCYTIPTSYSNLGSPVDFSYWGHLLWVSRFEILFHCFSATSVQTN